MVWITAITSEHNLKCGACLLIATCVLHDGRVLDGSTRVRFFCGTHLRSYLEEHPALLDAAINNLGSDALFAFYKR